MNTQEGHHWDPSYLFGVGVTSEESREFLLEYGRLHRWEDGGFLC